MKLVKSKSTESPRSKDSNSSANEIESYREKYRPELEKQLEEVKSVAAIPAPAPTVISSQTSTNE